MCLDNKKTKKEKRKWLKTQPNIVTAYKTVRIEEGKLFSFHLYSSDGAFQRKNRLKRVWSDESPKRETTFFGSKKEYIAYYHLFLSRDDAVRYGYPAMSNNLIVIECEVPKRLITEVGENDHAPTIVARGFTIVGQDEYLK